MGGAVMTARSWRHRQCGTARRVDGGTAVFGPQGTGFFLVLIVVFGALLFWVAKAQQVVFRVFAACLAFIPAMLFGVAAVNKYYDYYQSWSSAISDLTGGGAANLPKYSVGSVGSGKQIEQGIARDPNQGEDAIVGFQFRTSITGPQTHITRDAYVWLPPQYFQPAYKHYKFPVIELLHGSPGSPSAWVNVLNVITTFLDALANHTAQPAVLLMPDTDGGQRYSLQCLNNPGGIQDMTYVAKEVPEVFARSDLRVQPPGKAWGVAGYSEGGYCAANIALNNPGGYGYAGVLSGYFVPGVSQVPLGGKPGARPVRERVFRNFPALAVRNSPVEWVTRLPINVLIPQFWLAAGSDDKGDVAAAQQFSQLLSTRQADVPLFTSPGGHTGMVWRAALTPMLAWMTPQLADQVQIAEQNAASKAKQTGHKPVPHGTATVRPVSHPTKGPPRSR